MTRLALDYFYKMALLTQLAQFVWQKALIVPGYDHNIFRKDACGAWIRRDHYGNRDSQYGWEIDHITPVSHGGNDALFNLRPLHWQNNAGKSDGRLTCLVGYSV